MMTAVFPITMASEWRSMIDVIAVGSYLVSGLPLIFIALQELGFINAVPHKMTSSKYTQFVLLYF
jgi:hypothetical protein